MKNQLILMRNNIELDQLDEPKRFKKNDEPINKIELIIFFPKLSLIYTKSIKFILRVAL